MGFPDGVSCGCPDVDWVSHGLFPQEEFSSPDSTPDGPPPGQPIIAQPAPTNASAAAEGGPITMQPTERTSLTTTEKPMYGVDSHQS